VPLRTQGVRNHPAGPPRAEGDLLKTGVGPAGLRESFSCSSLFRAFKIVLTIVAYC
jgi:hypothetical protein